MREGGAWTVCRFKKGAWRKKRGGGVFEGGVDAPMHIMFYE